ncbi:helix-turn-helix domain-containing protein [Bacillus infantis]|uniref:helix-turn-helix domain-containing protein n=1 Tax=Bacillus infantis TaxID=324767 RepID=UPI003CECE807
MPPKHVIGRCLLLDILNKKYMTQADLVIKTGLSKSQISEYIGNKNVMGLNAAVIIAHALGCKVEELYELHIED